MADDVWRPPEINCIKLNVDASFFLADCLQGSTGVGVRDHEGKLIPAQALWYEHEANSFVMEALAIRDGVRLAGNMGLRNIIIETDALEITKL